MAQSFNLPARSLPIGDTIFGPFAMPVGTRQIEMILDVTSMVPGAVDANGVLVSGQRVWVVVEYNDGVVWTGARADFLGPWQDKQGVLHNEVTLRFGFGGVMVNGVMQSRASGAGWQARAKFTVEGGAYNTSGGTLTLS